MSYLRVLLSMIKFCRTYRYSRIGKTSISPVVPTGTPVSDKFCLCIGLVVPTGIPLSDKSCISISPVVTTGIPVSDKSCIYNFCIRISSVLYLICSVVPTGTPVSDNSCI